jgi:hypothetical protein
MSTEEPSPVFACDLTALDQRQWKRHRALQAQLQGALIGVEEVSTGYRFRYTGSRIWVLRVAEFITLERLCCPFFTFGVEVAPQGALWLSLTGQEGVKPLIRAEFGITHTEAAQETKVAQFSL